MQDLQTEEKFYPTAIRLLITGPDTNLDYLNTQILHPPVHSTMRVQTQNNKNHKSAIYYFITFKVQKTCFWAHNDLDLWKSKWTCVSN